MIKTLTIGNVELPNRYVLAPMAGVTDPAISSVMQGTGSRASVHGNDQCKGAPV
jgi:tRNA-dihydrouridine synthase